MGARSEQTEGRRIQIRNAARQLFLRHGFQGTSTDAVMSAAGVASKETLYRYFRSKEEMFVEVVRSMTVEGPYLKGLLERDPLPRTAEELRALVRSFVLELLKTMLQPDYLALMRITIGELPKFPELGELFRQAVPLRAMRYLRSLAKAGQITGMVRAGKDPEITARMIMGTLLTYAIFDGLLVEGRKPRLPGPTTVEAIVENILDIV